MICKLVNASEAFVGYVLDTSVRVHCSVSLGNAILIIGTGIFVAVAVAWWMIPLRKITFDCAGE